MQAVILAAGEGQRLRPLTATRPKPMLPVANRPLLEHTVRAVADAGFEEILLVVGYHKERIQEYFGDGEDWNVDLTHIVQEEQLGSGDALLQAEAELDGEFVVLNGDEVHTREVIEGVVNRREETGAPVIAVTTDEHPEDYQVVEIEDDRVTNIRERRPVELLESNLINAGVYAFGPGIFDVLRTTEYQFELGIRTALRRRLDEQPVRPYRHDHPRLDVTTPWDLLNVNARLVEQRGTTIATSASIHHDATVAEPTIIGDDVTVEANASVLGRSTIGGNARIGPNAVLTDCVVLPGATVKAGALLDRCIVGQDAHLGVGVAIDDGPTSIVLADSIYHDVELGGVIGDEARIGANVTGLPGVMIGYEAEVAGGAVIEGRIADRAEVTRG